MVEVEGKEGIQEILSRSAPRGWVLEPDAMRILMLAGLTVPRFIVAATPAETQDAARQIGYPLVAKVVSPDVLHKSEVHGVEVGIESEDRLLHTFERLSSIQGFTGMIVEEIVNGLELILGAQNDSQFGPMILLGIGGTSVEIYHDISLRMAPLEPRDVGQLADRLRGRKLLDGYRGSEPISREELTGNVLAFSRFIMDFHDSIQSVDINPLKCTAKSCTAVDARIMLVSNPTSS